MTAFNLTIVARTTLVALTATLATAAFAGNNRPAPKPEKATIILVHGAFQDATAWKKVVPLLEKYGHKTIAVNLPGRKGDNARLAELTTTDYRDAILAAMKGERNPVVLVGHSFGGIQIANVVEAAPERVKSLVFLAALLPKNGDSLKSLSGADEDSLLNAPGNVMFSSSMLTASIDDDAKADIFANDAEGAQRDAIVASLIREPAAPLDDAVTLTPERFGKAEKHFIKTLRDNAVSPELQDEVIATTNIVKVHELDTGHAPYITRPVELAEHIHMAAGHGAHHPE